MTELLIGPQRSNEFESLVKLEEPQCDVGAPLPQVEIAGKDLHLFYYLQRPMPEFDGTNPRLMTEESDNELVGHVTFINASAHRLGAPDEDCLYSHRFNKYGLWPHSSYVVVGSKYVPTGSCQRHYIFTFHDETLEVIADGYEFRSTPGSLNSVMAEDWYDYG